MRNLKMIDNNGLIMIIYDCNIQQKHHGHYSAEGSSSFWHPPLLPLRRWSWIKDVCYFRLLAVVIKRLTAVQIILCICLTCWDLLHQILSVLEKVHWSGFQMISSNYLTSVVLFLFLWIVLCGNTQPHDTRSRLEQIAEAGENPLNSNYGVWMTYNWSESLDSH